MDFPKKGSKSSNVSYSSGKEALEFLRKDGTRFSNGPLTAISKSALERQRKQLVNKRYMQFMINRNKSAKLNTETPNFVSTFEDEISKVRSRTKNARELRKEIKDPGTSSRELFNATNLLPWPGFRYHKNGELRQLTQKEVQQRLMASVRMGWSTKQTAPDVTWLDRSDSHENLLRTSSSLYNRQSLDSIKSINTTEGSQMTLFSDPQLRKRISKELLRAAPLRRAMSSSGRQGIVATNTWRLGTSSKAYRQGVSSNSMRQGISSNSGALPREFSYSSTLRPGKSSDKWQQGTSTNMFRQGLPANTWGQGRRSPVQKSFSKKQDEDWKSEVEATKLVEEKNYTESSEMLQSFINHISHQLKTTRIDSGNLLNILPSRQSPDEIAIIGREIQPLL